MTTTWRRKDGGWIRKDKKYRVTLSPGCSRHRPKWFAEVSQGGKWFAVKDKAGRNTRTWGEVDNAKKAIDKAFPVQDPKVAPMAPPAPPEKSDWAQQTDLCWARLDGRFRVQGNEHNNLVVVEAKNPGGNDSGWHTLTKRAAGLKDPVRNRQWRSPENAMKAIDRTYPMAPKVTAKPTMKMGPKAHVDINVTIKRSSSEASVIASQFLEKLEVGSLSLHVSEPNPKRACIQISYNDPKGTIECSKEAAAFVGSLEPTRVSVKVSEYKRGY